MINLDQLKEKIINEEKFGVIIENSEIKKMDLTITKNLKRIRKTDKKFLYISNY